MSVEELKKAACDVIDAAAHDLNTLSQQIWENPELGFKEFKASALLCDFLEKRDFRVERKFPVDTAFRATLGTAEEGAPVVVIICEYDALPVIGHACGHNLIAEAGVGAALGVQAAMTTAAAQGKRMGQLLVYGTPAEEGGGGKLDFIDCGAFKSPVSCAIMAHPGHINLYRPLILCSVSVTVTYRGRAAHAAAAPWEGINALDAAVMAYNSISVLRQQLPTNWRIHGIITNGGSKPNIIPEETSMEFYIRTNTPPEMARLRDKADACFNAAAQATSCSVEIKWADRPYENVLANATLESLYIKNAEGQGLTLVGPANRPPAGSTDMGNVSHVIPSIHPAFYVGNGLIHTRPFQAIAGSSSAQQHTIKQAKVLATTAIDVFCQPELVIQMANDLQRDLEKEQQA